MEEIEKVNYGLERGVVSIKRGGDVIFNHSSIRVAKVARNLIPLISQKYPHGNKY